ncbi:MULTISPECIES: Gfo/Idh/MocA family protein [unclassified Polaribacter]|uniref:Gfo/Idh/MocA family protein n=1 Tax=unclassified Polaribacter TaxID=196858 RepID=UPI0011BD9F18|nr:MULTISPECIES: Gfo/Idh/MocA family oxidoreductase [unclassified Polaribacter]TXD53123.1 Gfo/Idh/MocA family oxidoreductase [Polaribacter sp. IC063]TXD61243.1 Gfo/Idh/MocA family oxidoreductase [Polaribacter sp. IC066]
MKRRSFIKKGSFAATAIICSPLISSSSIKPNSLKPINIGVIGTGVRGSGLIKIINSIEGLNVSACCDILPFRLKEGLAKSESKPKGFLDYRQLLDDKTIDAVIIATTFNTHSKIAIDAVNAGKHVYCEKTLAKGYKNIKALVQKVKSSKIIFQTGHQYHSSRLYTHIVELIKNGKVGTIAAFECQWNRHTNWRRPVPSPEFEKAINWRMYKEFSGGLTAELCSHQIDFVNWVLDATPNTVMGVGGIDYWKDGRETNDNVHLIYNYPNGITAKFTCLTNNAKGGYQIKVLGDKGTILIDTKNAWFYPEGTYEKELSEIDGVSGATVQWNNEKGTPLNVEHLNPTKQALLDFQDSILNNKQPKSDSITGAKTAICVQMGLDAMQKNKTVSYKHNLIT